MKRTLEFTVSLCLMLLLISCIPERVTWSPDGIRALVMGDEAAYLCDPDGKLSPKLLEHVGAMQWMPDGKRFVVVRKVELKTWKEIETAFPREAADAKLWADETVKAIPKFEEGDQLDLDKFGLGLFYLRDEKPELIKGKLAGTWEEVTKKTIGAFAVQIYQAGDKDAKPGLVLLWTRDDSGILSLRVSPAGKAVALTRIGTDKSQASETQVLAADGSGELFKTASCWYPDWSPDGKYFIYMRPNAESGGNDNHTLGALVRKQILNDKGELLTAAEQQARPAEEELAAIFFRFASRVRVLKDGRVFFNSATITLPVAANDAQLQPMIFSVHPGKQPTVSRVLPANTLRESSDPDSLVWFDVSPDGQWIALPSPNLGIKLISVGTGEVREIQKGLEEKSGERDIQLQTLPSWRGPGELTFLRQKPDTKSKELVRYTLETKETKVISNHWPEEATQGWLTEKKKD